METYFKKGNCDEFSKFNSLDLREMLNELEKELIEYREYLNLKQGTTIGIEIEFENADFFNVDKQLSNNNNLKNWKIEDDISVQKRDWTSKLGGEINSPIITNSHEDWQQLKEMCQLLKNNGAQCLEKAGGHIHVGAQILENDTEKWKNFLKLWAVYEKIVYRFSYCERVTPRNYLKFYAKPIAQNIVTNMKQINEYCDTDYIAMIKEFGEQRNQGLNLSNLTNYKMNKQTMEFRCPNGTLEEAIWQNNVNFFVSFVNYVNNNNFDKEKLESKIISWDSDLFDLEFYGEIYLSDALELADMIYDNNLDKCYFLKQYLKDFKTSENINNQVKKFVK